MTAELRSRPRFVVALRLAASDLWANAWPLVAANVLCGAAILAVVAVWIGLGTLTMIVLLPLLGLPMAGLARIAGLIVRGRPVVLSDAWSAWRTTWIPALVLAAGLTVSAALFTINLLLGLRDGTLLGFSVAMLSAWGLLATWVFAVIAWPVLMDPLRAGTTVRHRLRVAAAVGLAFPLRLGSFSLLLAVVIALSTLAVVAVLTVSLATVAVIAARYVLPAADLLVAP